jgi:Zn-dependent protease with chaperone function
MHARRIVRSNMKKVQDALAIILSWLLVVQSTASLYAQEPLPPPAAKTAEASPSRAVPPGEAPPTADEVVKLPSVEIAATAEKFSYDQRAIQAKREAIQKESRQREEAFKKVAKAAEKHVEAKEGELRKLGSTVTDPQTSKKRKEIRCEILKTKKEMMEKSLDFIQAQNAADVIVARLNLLANWRTVNQQLEQKIAGGTIAQRTYGNVLDIGNRGTRKPFKGQQDDVRWGQSEIDMARERKMFPQEIEDPVVKEYVNRVATNLGRHSDLQVPLKVFVVEQELRKNGRPVLDKNGQPQQVANAMALPGGFLIVFAGVMLESENESELAGVLAHEMAHAAARHSNRMRNKGKVFSIAQLATIIGLQFLAPGLFSAASYLGYYLKGLLLQAIFDGMGIVFTLDALGVSRDFELEADQLGMQYAWNTGYDPEGFVKLFDHMAEKEGYASHTSFFATHPAFGDRIINSLREYKALRSVTVERTFLTDTSEFQEMKERLRTSLRKAPKPAPKDANKPTLKPEEPEPDDCSEVLSPAPPPSASMLRWTSCDASHAHP